MDNLVVLRAVVGEALSVKVYRGFAPLSELARISRPDVFHPDTNPRGTQRDLNVAHAKEAHAYAGNASQQEKRFWPEIVLNIRRMRGIKITTLQKVKGGGEFVKITVNVQQLELTEINPSISRVDGNHRLYFAQGDAKRKLKPLATISPFAITQGLSPDDELRIFRDINNEQRPMNTSHLDNVIYRLMPEHKVFVDKRELWIAEQLSKRETSPFAGKVYVGGKKEKGRYLITLRGLESATKEMLGISQIAGKLDQEKLYKLVENYWAAVQETWPSEWSDTKNYKLMTNAPGLSALGRVGGKLVDTQLRKGRVKREDLLTSVAQLRQFVDWLKTSEMMRGMAGPGAAKRIAEAIEKGLPGEVDLGTIEV